MSDEQVDATQSNAAPDGVATDGNESSGTTSVAGGGFKAITSQEELNAVVADRIARERNKFKDYNDLKTKAAKFDEITEAQKSELQRATERAEAAERRAQELESTQQIADWKSAVSKKTGVPADVLRGSTEAEIRAHAESLKAILPDPNARTNSGAYVASEGRAGAATGSPKGDFTEALRQAGLG